MLPLCLQRTLWVSGENKSPFPSRAGSTPSHRTCFSHIFGVQSCPPFLELPQWLPPPTRSTVILNAQGLQTGLPPKASEDDERLLLTASPNLSNVKQEVTYTHAPPDLTLGQNGHSSKSSSWQASLSACDYCHGPAQAQKSELQMPCHPQPA